MASEKKDGDGRNYTAATQHGELPRSLLIFENDPRTRQGSGR